MTTRGTATPTPILAPVLNPPEELDGEGKAVELETVCGRLVEVAGTDEEEAEGDDVVDDIDVDDDDDDDDEVAEARFVCPEARSTAEKGYGWRLLVSPELQQLPLPPSQHQLLLSQRLTLVKPL